MKKQSFSIFLHLLITVFLFFVFSPSQASEQAKVGITWLGHGSFSYTSPSGTVIMIDPWLTTNPRCPAAFRSLRQPEKIDILLLTHGHVDHFMLPDCEKIINKFNPLVIAPWELLFLIKDLIPKANTKTFELGNKGTTRKFFDVKITMVHADHSSGAQLSGFEGVNRYAGEPCGFILEFENGTIIYHAGDTALFGDMKMVIREVYHPNVAILPVGGSFTMGPREAAIACKFIEPELAIPGHYATFPTLEQSADSFVEYVKEFAASTTVRVLNPGETIFK